MRFITALGASLLLASTAFAGGPTQGTYAGDRTVGANGSVKGHKSNEWTAERTPGKSDELPGEVAEDITGHISDPNVVGNAPHVDPASK